MRSTTWGAAVARRFINCGSGCFFQQELLDPLSPSAAHRNREMWHFDLCPRRRKVAEPVKNESTNCVDSFRLNLETEMFTQIVKARISADKKFSVLERLNVRVGISTRNCVAEDFLYDVPHCNDSFGPAKFVNHDRQPLGIGQEYSQQFQRTHRL